MVEIRALTVRRPWAACIASGRKAIENRTWGTHYRGRIAIHAGAASDPDARADRAMAIRIDEATWNMPPRFHGPSQILAVADLVDCHKSSYCCGPWGEEDAQVWHWVLKDIRALAFPIPAKGRLGLWKPEPDLIEQINAQLEES